MAIVICDYCGTDFNRKPSHIESAKNHFCSRECYFEWRHGENNPMYGRKRLDTREMMLRNNPAKKSEVRKKISEARKGQHNSPETEFKKGLIPWNKGIPAREWMTEEGYERMIATLTEFHRRCRGSNHWNWKGGKTEENILIRGQWKYTTWRKRVFKRDNYTCQRCGNKQNIIAHHIKDFMDYPKLRFDVNNGITLCRACHKQIHFGGGDAA